MAQLIFEPCFTEPLGSTWGRPRCGGVRNAAAETFLVFDGRREWLSSRKSTPKDSDGSRRRGAVRSRWPAANEWGDAMPYEGNRDGKHYWLTPPDLMAQLQAEFNFDFDACPYPRPEGFDGLEVEWGGGDLRKPAVSGAYEMGPQSTRRTRQRQDRRLRFSHRQMDSLPASRGRGTALARGCALACHRGWETRKGNR